MSVPDWMSALNIPAACVSNRTVVEENKRRFSVSPRRGQVKDKVWSVHIDGCWLNSADGKKVDYLFWIDGTDGRTIVLLVELKGQNYKKALQQIEATLQRLCKLADSQGVHTGAHHSAPKHFAPASGGVRAYVILSRGNEVAIQQAYAERLRRRYGVIVVPRSQQFEIDLTRLAA
jgi:hypothetical protein